MAGPGSSGSTCRSGSWPCSSATAPCASCRSDGTAPRSTMPASSSSPAPPSPSSSSSRSAASASPGRRPRPSPSPPRRSAEPILPPHFLADRVIRPVLGSSFIVYGSYLAIAVLAPIYFQVALGVRVDEAGLLMIPLMLSSTVTANVAGRWSRRSGRYKRPPLLGLPVTVATMAVIALLAQRWSAPAASIALMLAGFGLGPFFPCSTVAAQNAVERGDLGAVSGAIAFSRALGGAIAIAAASALVLGLAAHALPGGNKLASIEDLTRQALPPEARAAVAGAFGIMFGAATALLALGLAVFARVEDRMLRDRPAMAEVPAD